jgi:RimJ/RimL family protein N-acetyltransferase
MHPSGTVEPGWRGNEKDATGEVTLRCATWRDCWFVFRVNSNPSVRENAIDRSEITRTGHAQWFRERLVDDASLLWIVCEAGQPVGVVRFDLDQPAARQATITVAVSERARGRGIGRRAIWKSTEAVLGRDDVFTAVALIRSRNRVSRRVFEQTGYVDVGATEMHGVWLRRLERRVEKKT